MKWVDYREKLGIGFNDKQKFKMLSAMLKNYVDNVIEENYDESSHLNYCQMVGEDYYDYNRPYQHLIKFKTVLSFRFNSSNSNMTNS